MKSPTYFWQHVCKDSTYSQHYIYREEECIIEVKKMWMKDPTELNWVHESKK